MGADARHTQSSDVDASALAILRRVWAILIVGRPPQAPWSHVPRPVFARHVDRMAEQACAQRRVKLITDEPCVDPMPLSPQLQC